MKGCKVGCCVDEPPTSNDTDGEIPPSAVGFGGMGQAGNIAMRELIDM